MYIHQSYQFVVHTVRNEICIRTIKYFNKQQQQPKISITTKNQSIHGSNKTNMYAALLCYPCLSTTTTSCWYFQLLTKNQNIYRSNIFFCMQHCFTIHACLLLLAFGIFSYLTKTRTYTGAIFFSSVNSIVLLSMLVYYH